MFAGDSETLKHLATYTKGKRLPDRNFVYDILQVLHPAFMSQGINEAKKQRRTEPPAKDFQEELLICEEIRQKMLKVQQKMSKLPHSVADRFYREGQGPHSVPF